MIGAGCIGAAARQRIPGANEEQGLIERNAGRIGDPIDDVEKPDDGADLHERLIADSSPQLGALAAHAARISAHHRVREREQLRAVKHTAVALTAPLHHAQVDGAAAYLAARTEQRRMRGGSVEALIQCRDARRH